MNLMRSICCFFSNQCGSEAGKGIKVDKDASTAVPGDANIAPEKTVRRAPHKTHGVSGDPKS